MSVPEWDARLRMHQFDGVQIAAHDYEGSAHQMTMMVTKKTNEDINQRECLVYPSLSSFVDPESTFGPSHLRMCEELSKMGKRTVPQELPICRSDNDAVHIILNDVGCTTSQALASSTNRSTTDARNALKSIVLVNFRRQDIQLYHRFIESLQGREELRTKSFSFTPTILNIENIDDVSGVVQSLVAIIDKCFSIAEKGTSRETRFSYSSGKTLIPRIVPYTSVESIISQDDSQQIEHQRQTGEARASNFEAVTLDHKGTYILAGEFGEASLTICQYLVTRGAKHVAFLSREAPNQGQQQILHELRLGSVDAEAVRWSAQDFQFESIAGSHTWPSLKGIFLGQMQGRITSKLHRHLVHAD